MSYSSRVYRQRNAHTHDETNQENFFSKQHDIDQNKKNAEGSNSGLKVNEPGDSYEKEADSVANAVVNQSARSPAVQQKNSSSVQRLSTSTEEDKFSTNDARMKKDKEVQRASMEPEKKKEEVQKKEAPKKEEEKVQKMEAPKKEEEKVQKKDEPKKEEEKVQKKEEPKKEEEKVQKKDEPKKEEEKKAASVQRKPVADHSSTSPEVTDQIKRSEGKGDKLPAQVLQEMNAGFQVDFSAVRIHNDNEAVHMSDQLEAQAFTHGHDIYFNEGKFDPGNSEGKQLLAHELTHVVQQSGNEMDSANDHEGQQARSQKASGFESSAGPEASAP